MRKILYSAHWPELGFEANFLSGVQVRVEGGDSVSLVYSDMIHIIRSCCSYGGSRDGWSCVLGRKR